MIGVRTLRPLTNAAAPRLEDALALAGLLLAVAAALRFFMGL